MFRGVGTRCSTNRGSGSFLLMTTTGSMYNAPGSRGRRRTHNLPGHSWDCNKLTLPARSRRAPVPFIARRMSGINHRLSQPTTRQGELSS